MECVVAENLVQIFHRGVLVGSYPQRPARRRVAAVLVIVRDSFRWRRPQLPVDGAEVIRMVDTGGSISFAGTTYWAGTAGSASRSASR